jgi:glutamate synthase domain-containing protein 3
MDMKRDTELKRRSYYSKKEQVEGVLEMKIEVDHHAGMPGIFVREDDRVRINANQLHYRELNPMVKAAAAEGSREIVLENIYGQRYIGSGIRRPVNIIIHGVPGNDLGAFMDGPNITVDRNAQDGVGNTMNNGTIVVHGRAGDIVAMGMRGGRIFIKESVGYRAAIHMKEYRKHVPVLVIGGDTQDFLGEYMAGGLVIVLGLGGKKRAKFKAHHIGTGMHGGAIFMRGEVEEYQLGKEARVEPADEEDFAAIRPYVEEFVGYFGGDVEEILGGSFIKLTAKTHRPFGGLYAY